MGSLKKTRKWLLPYEIVQHDCWNILEPAGVCTSHLESGIQQEKPCILGLLDISNPTCTSALRNYLRSLYDHFAADSRRLLMLTSSWQTPCSCKNKPGKKQHLLVVLLLLASTTIGYDDWCRRSWDTLIYGGSGPHPQGGQGGVPILR